MLWRCRSTCRLAIWGRTHGRAARKHPGSTTIRKGNTASLSGPLCNGMFTGPRERAPSGNNRVKPVLADLLSLFDLFSWGVNRWVDPTIYPCRLHPRIYSTCVLKHDAGPSLVEIEINLFHWWNNVSIFRNWQQISPYKPSLCNIIYIMVTVYIHSNIYIYIYNHSYMYTHIHL